MTKKADFVRKPLSLLLTGSLLTGIVCSLSFSVQSSDTDELNERKAAMLSRAADFLKQSQNSDGSFGNYTGIINETAEAANVLSRADPAFDLSSAKSWLTSKDIQQNTDTAARTAAAFSDKNILLPVLNYQNDDGGFGIKKNYHSDTLDSVLVLDAINYCGITEFEDQGTDISFWLANNAVPSGGWSYSSGSATDIPLTAMVEYDIAKLMNVNGFTSDKLVSVLDSADNYLTENVTFSFDKDKLENTLYSQIAHLEYTGKIDFKSVMEGLEQSQDQNGGFYDSVHLTALAMRLLENMDFENTLHIYDFDTAAGPVQGYLGRDLAVTVNYAVVYSTTMNKDCTIKTTVKNGNIVIHEDQLPVTLDESKKQVNGTSDQFVINEMNDDGISVISELYDGDKLLRSSEKTITLTEPPVAGSTDLNGFTLTMDPYSVYEGYPEDVTAVCELIYSTNVANSTDIHYIVKKGDEVISEKTVKADLVPQKNSFKAESVTFKADGESGTVYTVTAQCVYNGEVIVEREAVCNVISVPALPETQEGVTPEPALNINWFGPVLSNYCLYAGSNTEVIADAMVSYNANADFNRIVNIKVYSGEEVIAESTKTITLTPGDIEMVSGEPVYPIYQTSNMVTFTPEAIGVYKVVAELTDEQGNVLNHGEAEANVLPKPKQDLILNSDVVMNEDGKTTNSVDLYWNDISGDFETYTYSLNRREKGKEWEIRSIWNENEKVKVLNVYPAQPYLERWMTTSIDEAQQPAGMGLFDIDSVHIRTFNNDPLSYLKDESGKWKYDVIFFGSSDCNSHYDITADAADLLHAFSDDGRGILFGHDTICLNFGFYNFATFADDLGILVKYDSTVWSTTSASVIKIGTLTNFPWTIRGTLTIPSCHSYGQFVGGTLQATEWMQLNTSKRYDDATGSHSNFYLVTNKNLGMIQTGHSNGQATDDERKVLANTLFYLYQRSRMTTARDSSFYDVDAPDEPSAEDVTVQGNTASVKVSTKDNATTYEYYITAFPDSDAGNDAVNSNVVSETAFSGLKGYVSGVNDSTEPWDDLITYDENGEYVQNVILADNNGEATVTGVIPDTDKQYYLHIFAVDNANNVSKEMILPIGKAAVNCSINTDKPAYDVNETVKVSTESSAVLFEISADAVVSIYDDKNNLMQEIADVEAQNLTSDAKFPLDGTWLIPEIYSGTYTAVIRWSINGEEISSAECQFVIAENGEITNSVNTDQTEYTMDENIGIMNTVANLSTNADADSLALKVVVKGTTADEAASFNNEIPVLYLGANVQYNNLIPAGTLSDGRYTVTAAVVDKENNTLSTDSAVFTVNASSGVLTGTLKFSDKDENSENAAITVLNNTTQNLAGAIINVTVTSMKTGEVVGHITKTDNISGSEAVNYAELFDTSSLENGDYLGILTVTAGDIETELDQDTFTVNRTIPESSDPTESSEPAESSKPTESSEPTESSKPTESSDTPQSSVESQPETSQQHSETPSEQSSRPEPSEASTESQIDNSTSDTGDHSAAAVWFLIFVVTLSAITVIVITEVKRNANKNH